MTAARMIGRTCPDGPGGCDCDYCCPHATNCTSRDTAPADPSDDYYA